MRSSLSRQGSPRRDPDRGEAVTFTGGEGMNAYKRREIANSYRTVSDKSALAGHVSVGKVPSEYVPVEQASRLSPLRALGIVLKYF